MAGEKSATGEPLLISEAEIASIIRAKAALILPHTDLALFP